MTWWSTAWAYRVPVTVTNPPLINGYPHSGYPHREVVSFRTGMQRDFDDVRFATDDGIVLDYWKETYATANSAVIWVNLPAGATSIWMYYGNAAATDIGSRDNAYILYDDFNYPDPALWMSSPSGSYYVQNGWIWDEQSRGPGVLVSNNPVITDGEPVIVEMRIFANSLPPRYTFCGYFPQFIDTSPTNGLLWYPIHERRVTMGGATSWQSGSQRGLLPGATCFNTWLITPSSQTHTVSGSVSYSDVFQETTGISNHRMMLFGGDNSVPGRSIRMDWIRVRKYVETEPAFCYGTPQTCPIVTITSPGDDTVGAGGNVTVVGTISSSAVSSLTLTHNNVSSIVPVQDGNFSVEVTLADANTIMANGTDSFGNTFSVTLLLDGDMLPGAFEQEIGFDPLNADSNCSGWPEDQSGNGVIDGYEIFAGDLPVFAKYRIGANPFVADTDGDGLNDSFELLKLGTFPEQDEILAVIHSTEGNHSVAVGVGTDDDPDGDGLSNYEEQGYGTDPLSADTDDDGLSDADEISMWTCPCDADSDDDGLADGAEVALGTNATDPYSGGDGIPDGAKDYWSGERFLDDTLDLTVFGRGYAVANVSAAEVNYTHLISEEILVSKVAAIGFGDDIESGTIEIAYDPTHVENASRLSVYRFDEDLGTFVNVSSTVDSENWVVSCEAAGSAKYAIMDSARWDALFDEEPLASLMASSVSNYATVHVTDAVTGNPVGNATVTFTCLSDGFVYAYVTDSNGYTSTSYSDASNIQYQITKTGYRTFTGLLKADPVYDQEHITIHPSIVPTNAPCGNIDVDTDPDGADIYVDGVLRGGSPHVVVNLLEDDHTVEVKMTGYESASTPVPVYGGQITPVAFDLSPVLGTGTIWVSTGPGGAQVYLDGVYKGVTDENEELTISDVPVGNHRVVIQKDGYIPVTRVVTVELNETTNISVALNNDDLDEDGLLDGFENGYRDGFGRWHTVDPYAIDTDGDGLSDGFEAGESVTDENGTTYFRPRSDPNKADTDDDGLDDLAEFEYGADPFNPDTDGDGLRDGADPDPLTPAASGDINLAKIAREILAGAVFGETGLPDGSFYWLVGEETASSPYYMVGWIGFSCLPVVGGIADIRDAVQAILNGDAIGAAMNAAGAIPGPGDGIKITGAIVCYTGKFPWKARELGVLLSKELLGPLPDTIKIQVWDLLFDGAGSRLVRGEIGAGDVAKVIEQNGNIERTLSVIKRTDGKVFWLEEGKLGTAEGATSWVYDEKGGSGWVHIVNNHINHPNGNQFEDAFGDAYKGDHNLIKDLIMDCAKTGLLDPNNPGHYWKKIGDRYLIAVVGSNGYLVTSHPVKNTDVPQVIKNMFS